MITTKLHVFHYKLQLIFRKTMLQLQSQLVFVISIFFSIKVQNIYFEGNMQVKFKFVRLLYNL